MTVILYVVSIQKHAPGQIVVRLAGERTILKLIRLHEHAHEWHIGRPVKIEITE